MSAGLPVDTTVDNTLGAVLVGFAVACTIYGILLSQVFSYFSSYPLDRWVYKFLVLLILVMETSDQALIGHVIYHYGITNFAKPFVLLKGDVTWSFILQQTIGDIVGAIVKSSFTLRVWRFSECNWVITVILMSLVFGQLALSLAYTVKAFRLSSVFQAVQLQTLGSVTLGVGVLTDAAIAVALCYFLNRLRTGHRHSDTLVNSLVRYAVNTGAITSAVSLTTLILYNLYPHNLVFIATFFILSKFYAISFMATLNTRRVVRGQGTDRQGTERQGGSNDPENNTNMFHLGTRLPSMGPNDMDGWEAAFTPSKVAITSVTYSEAYSEAPFSSYHSQSQSTQSQMDRFQKLEYGEAILLLISD
ncbi:hypothetical protein E1B28_002286 [Marasmius oreades]|uniref:DUF6534 domain-containing protein n=1 Tax=Marasmius oreades TaxID=181124 RepID=A0A9P7RNT8_9AGAR|nr:uncharacterized protein E1B28_002286 [Marasmius oreades]KAG7086323.1 hypothetical protein E1B28_002286 [Marasmius oreades]